MAARIKIRKKDSWSGAALKTKLDSHDATLDALDGATLMMKKFVFTGKNGAGACTLTGAAVGDRVVGVTNLTDATATGGLYETTITVVNQIQQNSGSDLSAKKNDVLLITPVR